MGDANTENNFLASNRTNDYLLGSTDEEVNRLGFQHQLWSVETHALWRRAGFGMGQVVLDLGCGPGFAALALAPLLGQHGKVIAIDLSEKFVETLKRYMTDLGIQNIEPIVADAHELEIPDNSLDGVYCRFLMWTLKDRGNVIRKVYKALKPSGRFALTEYFTFYPAFFLSPNSAIFDKVIRAIDQWAEAQGVTFHSHERVPRMMHEAGFTISSITPLVRLGKPNDVLGRWVELSYFGFLSRIVNAGFWTQGETEEFWNDWNRKKNDPTAFFITPPILDVIGIKE